MNSPLKIFQTVKMEPDAIVAKDGSLYDAPLYEDTLNCAKSNAVADIAAIKYAVERKLYSLDKAVAMFAGEEAKRLLGKYGYEGLVARLLK